MSDLRACQAEWFDAAWWQDEVRAVIADSDPVRANLRITLSHDRLSLALRSVTGVDAGANFHTWAVWGSRKAGATIRCDDTARVRQGVQRVATMAGLAASLLALRARGRAGHLGSALLASACLSAPAAIFDARLRNTARHVLAGNCTVLEDIGLPTSRFVALFWHAEQPDNAQLEQFLATLRPGATPHQGQELLRRAFTHYYRARWATTPEEKHQLMLAGNYAAILHEHLRLDPYIDAAIPLLWRRWSTRRLLSYSIGSDALRVGADLAPLPDGPFPPSLRQITLTELQTFLHGPMGWDRTPESLHGSAAEDWTELDDRMNYIVDLFRAHHLHDAVFAAPYTPEQIAAIDAGRIPPGPL